MTEEQVQTPFKTMLKNFLSSVNPRDEIYPEADWNKSTSYYPANSGIGLAENLGRKLHPYASTCMLPMPRALRICGRCSRHRRSNAIPFQMVWTEDDVVDDQKCSSDDGVSRNLKWKSENGSVSW